MKDELIRKLIMVRYISTKLIGEIIDNYEADAINLPAEMYNELKFHLKQLNKIAALEKQITTQDLKEIDESNEN